MTKIIYFKNLFILFVIAIISMQTNAKSQEKFSVNTELKIDAQTSEKLRLAQIIKDVPARFTINDNRKKIRILSNTTLEDIGTNDEASISTLNTSPQGSQSIVLGSKFGKKVVYKKTDISASTLAAESQTSPDYLITYNENSRELGMFMGYLEISLKSAGDLDNILSDHDITLVRSRSVFAIVKIRNLNDTSIVHQGLIDDARIKKTGMIINEAENILH